MKGQGIEVRMGNRTRAGLAAMLIAAAGWGAVSVGRAMACDEQAGAGAQKATVSLAAFAEDEPRVHSRSESVASTGENTIRVVSEDGEVEIFLNGEKVQTFHADQDWEQYEVADASGEVIGTVINAGRHGVMIRIGNDEDAGRAWSLHGPGGVETELALAEELDDFASTAFTMASEPPKVMMGVTLGRPDAATAHQLGIDPEKCTLIESVVKGLAADRAGVKQYDIIVSVNGDSDASQAKLREVLRSSEPGDVLKLKLRRGSEEQEVELKLDAYDAEALGISISPFGTTAAAPFAWRMDNAEKLRTELEELEKQISKLSAEFQGKSAQEMEELGRQMAEVAEEMAEKARQLAERSATTRFFLSEPWTAQTPGQIRELPRLLDEYRMRGLLELRGGEGGQNQLLIVPEAPDAGVPLPPQARERRSAEAQRERDAARAAESDARAAEADARLKELDARLERLEQLLEKLVEEKSRESR